MLLVAAVMLVCASCSSVPAPAPAPQPQTIVGPTYANPPPKPAAAAPLTDQQKLQGKVDDLTAGVKRLQQLLHQGE